MKNRNKIDDCANKVSKTLLTISKWIPKIGPNKSMTKKFGLKKNLPNKIWLKINVVQQKIWSKRNLVKKKCGPKILVKKKIVDHDHYTGGDIIGS